jgi:hypothetical protein
MLVDNFIRNIFVLNTVELSDGTTADVDTISVGTGGTAFWFYESSRSTIRQGGLLLTTWNADSSAADVVRLSTDEYNEYGVGDSTDLTIDVVVESGNVILRATSMNNWTIKYKRLKL